MDALADFWEFVGKKVGANVTVERLPGFARVTGAKRACGRDANDEVAFAKALNGMHHHAASTGSPLFSRGMKREAGHHFPIRTVVPAAEEHAGIGAGVDDTGSIGSGRGDVPDAF